MIGYIFTALVGAVAGILLKEYFSVLKEERLEKENDFRKDFEKKVRTIAIDVSYEHAKQLSDRIEKLTDALGYKKVYSSSKNSIDFRYVKETKKGSGK